MREWRKTHPLNSEQRRRLNARSYAHVYVKRGKIKKGPCRECGSEKSEMHHEDYDKPTEVVWFCRKCHLKHHRAMAMTKGEGYDQGLEQARPVDEEGFEKTPPPVDEDGFRI